MRLSLSIQMDVLKAKAGSILNTFKVLPRRDVLFFEDIFANYVLECEKAGFGKEVYDIGKKWNALGTSRIPSAFRSFGIEYIVNLVVNKVWINLGLLDEFRMDHSGKVYTFSTKNEFITRVIGENMFTRGGAAGSVAGFYNRDAACREYSQTKNECRYVIELLDAPFVLTAKGAGEYARLNAVLGEGFSLKKALLSGFFQLRDNRITFRSRTLLCLENTGFHLIGGRGILLERLADITASFFKDLIEKEASPNSKLVLLKNILQACGWGDVALIREGGLLKFLIAHPPYGLQVEEDNWAVLSYLVLGYLRLISKKVVLDKTELLDGKLLIIYSGLGNRQE